MKKIITLLLSFLLVFCLQGESTTFSFQEYENRILKEAELSNKTLTKDEIKERIEELKTYSAINRFDEDISRFMLEDSKKMPPYNSLLFIGSSSIRYWKSLEEDMSPFKVINRGFGGAHIAHVNRHFNKIVKPYKPKGIIFFCGSNDINALKDPIEVFKEFREFFNEVQTSFKKTKIFVIGIKPSIARDYQREKQKIWNKAVKQMANEENNLYFIDVLPSMLLDGKANPELFVSDGLHMNKQGYEVWTKLLKPVLLKHFNVDA